jgi:4-carboxymuconolactone decarboxylase
MTRDIAARMAEVCSEPPRLEPLSEAALGEREMAVVQRMRELTSYPEEKQVHPFFTTLAHQPVFFEAYMQLGISAMASAVLPLRTRELIILRTGWLCGAPYQFGEHVVTAKKIGVTAEEIERIKQGSSAEEWSESDRAVLKAAEELHADAIISDGTWAALAQQLSRGELIELIMIAGHYHLTAFLQNSLRFRLNDYNLGLESV